MQNEKVKDQQPKAGSAWGYIRTIECYCGYIATFETWKFDCPDCGRRHYLFSNKVRHLTPPAPDAWESAPLQAVSYAQAEITSQTLSTPTKRR